MIQATVSGNIGRDPEMKDTKSGKKMATFSVASTTKREGRDPETTWLDVVCFDDVADGVAGNFRKGMKVILTGQLSLETYSKKDGSQGSSLRMVCNEIGLSARPPKESRDEDREDRGSRRSRNDPW